MSTYGDSAIRYTCFVTANSDRVMIVHRYYCKANVVIYIYSYLNSKINEVEIFLLQP